MFCENCEQELNDLGECCSNCREKINHEKNIIFFKNNKSKNNVGNIIGFIAILLFSPTFFLQVYAFGINWSSLLEIEVTLLFGFYGFLIFVFIFSKIFKDIISSKILLKSTYLASLVGSIGMGLHFLYIFLLYTGINNFENQSLTTAYIKEAQEIEMLWILSYLIPLIAFSILMKPKKLKENLKKYNIFKGIGLSKNKGFSDKNNIKNKETSLEVTNVKSENLFKTRGFLNSTNMLHKNKNSINNSEIEKENYNNKNSINIFNIIKNTIGEKINPKKLTKIFIIIICLFGVTGFINSHFDKNSNQNIDSHDYSIQTLNYYDEEIDSDILLELVERNDLKNIEAFLNQNSIDVNIKNSDYLTPLIIATINDSLEIIDLLLRNGADIELKGGFDDISPLGYAVIFENYKSAEFLLRNGANVNSQDIKYNTPLIAAIEVYNFEMIELLINYGADVLKPNVYGFTAIDCIIMSGVEDIKLEIPETVNKIVGKWEAIVIVEETKYGDKTEYKIDPNSLIWHILSNQEIFVTNHLDNISIDAVYNFDGRFIEIEDDLNYEKSEVYFYGDNMYITNQDNIGNQYTLVFNRKQPFRSDSKHTKNRNHSFFNLKNLVNSMNENNYKTSVDVIDFIGKRVEDIEDKTGKRIELVDIDDILDEEDLFTFDTFIETEFYNVYFSKENIAEYILLFEKAEVLGVEVGMRLDQIKNILGEPNFQGISPDWEEFYEIIYIIDDIIIGFYSSEDSEKTIGGYIYK